jgi:hypothetical protein
MQEITARDVGVAIFDGARMEAVPDMQPKIGDSVMTPAARKDGSFEEGSEASQSGFQKPCQIADAGQSVISNLGRRFWSLQRGELSLLCFCADMGKVMSCLSAPSQHF